MAPKLQFLPFLSILTHTSKHIRDVSVWLPCRHLRVYKDKITHLLFLPNLVLSILRLPPSTQFLEQNHPWSLPFVQPINKQCQPCCFLNLSQAAQLFSPPLLTSQCEPQFSAGWTTVRTTCCAHLLALHQEAEYGMLTVTCNSLWSVVTLQFQPHLVWCSSSLRSFVNSFNTCIFEMAQLKTVQGSRKREGMRRLGKRRKQRRKHSLDGWSWQQASIPWRSPESFTGCLPERCQSGTFLYQLLPSKLRVVWRA